ncbi:hypothetical protein GCM10009116_10160 [Brevundimonas basaltis]|uniref:Uncharacterized protein n=1 Tax=Brevundimonas basaltis TaxID=472166 RepID=A0A7W8MHA9_9CAUL|nr:hypothetical protein [Brevundimonas basaltis]MBB5292062.1 hypothetical protein [Brevundimonas basaltis]
MSSYYVIVNTPGVPVCEIAVLNAVDDATAREEAKQLARRWPGFETIALYDGERSVSVLANPHLGFADQPLDFYSQAA